MLQQFESKGKPFSEKMAKNERGDRSNNHVHGLLGGGGGGVGERELMSLI